MVPASRFASSFAAALLRARSLAALFVGSLLICAGAEAQSLVITDCQGFTRAAHSVDPGKSTEVQVKVKDTGGASADGAQITLTNVVTGVAVTTTAMGGVALFQNLLPGVYTLAASKDTIVLDTVSITTSGLTTVGALGVLGGAGAVGGGALVGIGLAIDNAGGGGNGGDQQEQRPPPSTPTPAPTPNRCGTCEPDTEPPVPPGGFFDQSQTREALALSPFS